MTTNQRLLDRARDHDWFAALTAAHEERGDGVLPLGPRGHAVVPRRVERAASQVRVAGTVFPRTSEEETVWDSRVPDLVFLRRDVSPSVVSADVEKGLEWETALAFLRLGLSLRLLDRVLTHLGDRKTDGAPLLHQQMIKGAIAEAVLDHLEIQAALDPPAASPAGPSWAALAETHRRITAVDRKLLLLFGASGFLEDGPGVTAYVSELLADAYIGPADWTEAP